MRPERAGLITLLSLGAGLLDSATGALLLSVPDLTLRMFGATLPGGGGDILMRFVGAFVLGVGLAYLWGLASSRTDVRRNRLLGVWGATAAVRTCVALFTLTAVSTGGLPSAWLVVSASDAVLAIVQIRGIRRGWFAT